MPSALAAEYANPPSSSSRNSPDSDLERGLHASSGWRGGRTWWCHQENGCLASTGVSRCRPSLLRGRGAPWFESIRPAGQVFRLPWCGFPDSFPGCLGSPIPPFAGLARTSSGSFAKPHACKTLPPARQSVWRHISPWPGQATWPTYIATLRSHNDSRHARESHVSLRTMVST